MGAITKTLYDTDFAEWSARTAELLRAGHLPADLENVAEEIEDLGKSERAAVGSQLERLLLHLAKQRIQPERDGASWRSSMTDARREIRRRIDVSPSLQRYLEESLALAYQRAVRDAIYETGTGNGVLPEQCPWSIEELLEGEPR